ncbi:PAS domain-containing protein [Hymenobacter edaphi]|uniref:histidine kinase n=1 Tax=Hymenobacter edaphi TaxID=2211146 RepID=A0A328BMC1_9BACT|nr:PAS domain-containing protein [Hymenobacter edaphi]RAK68263.1 hypothetical protein DLM85_09550 [Hymenobacter edaphi]
MPASLGSALTPERIDAALNAAGIGVWEMDLPAHRFTCSARCKHLFGLLPDADVTLADVLGASHPDDRARVEQQLTQALDPSGTGRLTVEYRVLLPEGQVRWVRTTGLAVFDAARSQALRFQGITKDITELQTEALRHRQRQQELQQLVELAPGMLWIAQPDGAVTYFNPVWLHYTGQTPAQALASGWQTVLHPDDLARCLARWTESVRDAAPYEIEYRLRRHDGAYRWFIGRAQPLLGAAGRVQKWFGSCTDIHAQKQIEQALRQREDELERAQLDLEAKIRFRTLALEDEAAQLRLRLTEPPAPDRP